MKRNRHAKSTARPRQGEAAPVLVDQDRWAQVLAALEIAGAGTGGVRPLYKHEPPRLRRPGRSQRSRGGRARAVDRAGSESGVKHWRWVLQSPNQVSGAEPAGGRGRLESGRWDDVLTDAWEFLFEGPPEVVDDIKRQLQLTEWHFVEWLRGRQPRARPESLRRARQVALGYLALSSPCLVYLGLLWNPGRRSRPAQGRGRRSTRVPQFSAQVVRKVRHDLALFRRSALYREKARLYALQPSGGEPPSAS